MILHSKIFGNNFHHLLIFHGLFGMSNNWLNISKQLCLKFTVHLIDLRNHGKSFHHCSMNLSDLAYDIFNYVNYYKLSKFSLLGHSLGGKAVMEYVFTYSSIFLYKIIIVDIAPKQYPPSHQNILNALNSIDFNILKTRKDVESFLKKFIFDEKIILFLLKNLYWNNQKLKFTFNLNAINQNYLFLINKSNFQGTFSKPTLFLYGEHSNYLLEEDKNMISYYFNNVQFYMIPNAHHWVHIDNPIEFTKQINFFLDC